MKSEVAIQALSRNPKQPIHLQFANARTVDELLNFVAKHGPVHGRIESKKRLNKEQSEKPAKEDLVVREDINTLIREQRLFRAAVLLLRELRGKRQDRVVIRSLLSEIRKHYPSETISDKWNNLRLQGLIVTFAMAEPTFTQDSKNQIRPDKMTLEKLRYDAILPGPKRTKEGLEKQRKKAASLQNHIVVGAHGVLCGLFNRFPLRMFSCAQGAIELPSYDREGILPILYFLLRRDYRDRHYLIKMCKECGATFKPERGDPDCCERKCYKRYNDRDRYLRKKLPRSAA
ncbi:MAG TPA: hypothetical protein VI386_08660 [Candidatus Sulfotelmatobacter sp.]